MEDVPYDEDVLYDDQAVQVRLVEHTSDDVDRACVSLSGNWSALTGKDEHAEDVKDLILEQPYSSLLLDLNGLKDVNSAFISLLVLLLESEKKVSLSDPSPFLMNLLEMVGISEAFHVYEDQETFFRSGEMG